MELRFNTALAAAILLLAPAAGRASLSNYSQNFEGLVQSNPSALTNDGWIVFGNVFTYPDHVFIRGYGPFPAPNGSGAYCAIDAGQGGVDQGLQQLSIYSDYGNQPDQTFPHFVEANTYHEQTIITPDIGGVWTLQFDAKLGNLTGASTAQAFIKTIAPPSYSQTNLVAIDMTLAPATWHTYRISFDIGAGLAGQLLQFGFASTATLNQGSGVFYDNVTWLQGTTDVPGTSRPNAFELRAAMPNPFRESTRIDYSMMQRGAAELSVLDVTGRRIATLFRGQAEAGPHVATWDGRSADGRLAPPGVYRCVLQTAEGRQSRSLVLSR